MWKKIIYFFISVGVLISLSGCSTKEYITTSDLDKEYACTINVCGSWGNFEALDEAALLFKEKYPNIDVIYNQFPEIDYLQDLQNRVVSGEDIDIYMTDCLNQTDSSMDFFWLNAEDMTDLVDMEQLDPDLVKMGYVDGKLIAMPLYYYNYGFIVNESLLETYNLQVPSTKDAFIECCDTFMAHNIYPILVYDEEYLANFFFSHIYSKVINSQNPEEIINKFYDAVDYDSLISDSIDEIAAFKAKGYIHPDSDELADGYNATILRFFEGDIPFVAFQFNRFSGTHKREAKSETFQTNPFSYNYIPVMGEDGYDCVFSQKGTIFFSVYSGIDEAKKPYVNEFMSFLASDEGSSILAETKNLAVSNKNVRFKNFRYLDELSTGQILYAGAEQDDYTKLRLNQLIEELAKNYSDDITSQELLELSIYAIEE